MAYLSLSLLGPFQAWTAGGSTQSFRTQKERALLAYLVVENGRPHRREELAGLFWPDRSEGVARNNLRQALYGLRQVIGETGFEAIFSVTGEMIRVNLSDQIWLDIAAYEVNLAAAKAHPHAEHGTCTACMQHLRAAIELYRGDFLSDVELENPQFHQWITALRAQYHRLQYEALESLIVEYERSADYFQAAAYAVNQARMDTLGEASCRRLMTLLAKAGRASAALEWYDIYANRLSTTSQIEPVEETKELAHQIRLGLLEPDAQGKYVIIHNLPEDLTPFIGREMELAQIGKSLKDPGSRLINIVGLAGVGKTRLAIQAARLHLRLFPDGVYLVPLEMVQTAEEMLDVIGQAVGLVPGILQDSRTVLLDYLRLKNVLLLLDNFEHLIESKGALLEILQAASFAKILLTSRERLRLQAEALVELDGLPFPQENIEDRAGVDGQAPLQEFAAVRLFLERASRLRPLPLKPDLSPAQPAAVEPVWSRLSIDPRELDAVARICQLVGGLPLGIELAASLTRDHSFEQVANEVQRSLDFLQSSFQDMPERQRSLAVSFEQSWDLLPENEREVLCKLAIFPADFSTQSAQVIAGAAIPWLMRLEDRSLVRRAGYGRYRLHPLIRQYAGQKLRQFSRRIETQALEEHARFFCSFLREREADLKGLRQAEAMDEISAEMENLQAAWGWAIEHQAVDLLEKAAFSLMYFLEARSRWREGEARFRSAVECLQETTAGSPAGSPGEPTLSELMIFWGWFTCRLTRFDQAEQLILQGLQQLPEEGQQQAKSFAHFTLGFLYIWMSKYQEALQHLLLSLSLSTQVNDEWSMAWASQSLAEISFESGQSGFSEAPFLRTLELFDRLGEQRGSSRALNYLANMALAQGQLEKAREYLEKMLAKVEKIGDIWGAAGGYNKLAQLALEKDSVDQSYRLNKRSLLMFQKMGDQRRSAYTLRALGEAAQIMGQPSEASSYFSQAFEIAARLHNPSLAQDILTGLAAALLQGKGKERAVELLARVLADPAGDHLTLSRASQLMDLAREDLPASSVMAACERAATGTFWAVIDGFLRDGVDL